ncbi:MAG: HD domain-containing protein [Fusobacteriaceae bacterium]
MNKELEFLIEIDKIKGILRQTLILGGERRENDAEHSWHMAMTAMTLEKYYLEPVNMEKVLKMVLIHDLVEIYAGDTPAFGPNNPNKFQDEKNAALKIFGFLPEELGKELLDLWFDFENGETHEAKFATACDRFQGFIQNLTSNGHSWRKYAVKKHQVLKRMEPIKDYLPKVFDEIVLPEIKKYIKLGAIQEDI